MLHSPNDPTYFLLLSPRVGDGAIKKKRLSSKPTSRSTIAGLATTLLGVDAATPVKLTYNDSGGRRILIDDDMDVNEAFIDVQPGGEVKVEVSEVAAATTASLPPAPPPHVAPVHVAAPARSTPLLYGNGTRLAARDYSLGGIAAIKTDAANGRILYASSATSDTTNPHGPYTDIPRCAPSHAGTTL